MKLPTLSSLALQSLLGAWLLAGCGGSGGESTSMSNASATSVRYAQTMTLTFNGLRLDRGVKAEISGPCDNLQRSAGGTANLVQFTCTVSGVGDIVATLIDNTDGFVYGSLKVNVPTPQVLMSVTDGTRTGTMLLELDPTAAPASVRHFLSYASSGYYNSTLFHRVSPGTGILGGGFTSSTDGVITAKLPTLPALPLERTGLKHLRGSIALYREAGLNTADSMFFINAVANPRFDAGSAETPDGYAVFGQVVQGLDVLDEIAKVPVRADLSLGVNDVPVTAVRISAVVQTR